MIKCEVCGKQMNVVSWKHLRRHDLTTEQYKQRFPTSQLRSDSAIARKKESAIRANADRVGVPRSTVTKHRISNTKQSRPSAAWNKGIPMSAESKAKLSSTRRTMFALGQLDHWNRGNTTPPNVREKIRQTSLAQRRTHTTTSDAKRRATLANKIKDGWVKKRTYEMTPEHLEAWRAGAVNANHKKTQRAIDRAELICAAHNLTVTHTTANSYAYVLQCNVCGNSFERTRNSFVDSKVAEQAFTCTVCFPRARTVSCGESELVSFIKQHVPHDHRVIQSDRSVLNGREIDCYIPALKLGIEYNGLYWHAERVSGKPPSAHNWKTKLAATKGVRLITIFEDEWLHRRPIVESRILHLLASSAQTTVFARKTTIREITSEDKNQFLSQNHIQGSDVSGVRYGAFFQDQLLAVMTFTKTNMVKGGNGAEYELNRFATKIGFHLPGIASRLFQAFVRQHKPLAVISYADRRWCTGQVYSQLGFAFDSVTPPSYWYLVNNYTKRVHRSNFMKHTLSAKLSTYDEHLTEWENMQANGYDRIWDCGTSKFVYTSD